MGIEQFPIAVSYHKSDRNCRFLPFKGGWMDYRTSSQIRHFLLKDCKLQQILNEILLPWVFHLPPPLEFNPKLVWRYIVGDFLFFRSGFRIKSPEADLFFVPSVSREKVQQREKQEKRSFQWQRSGNSFQDRLLIKTHAEKLVEWTNDKPASPVCYCQTKWVVVHLMTGGAKLPTWASAYSIFTLPLWRNAQPFATLESVIAATVTVVDCCV